MPKDAPFVVVGAGLPGIVAALTVAEKGRRCILIDTAEEIGGLLRSYEVDGYTFDFGTHFANPSGIAKLDRLLFGEQESEWKEYPVLSAGNFWNGSLNEGSDNPDLNSLARDVHYRCLGDLLSAPGWRGEDEPECADDYLVAEYGRSLVEVFFDPVLKKFTGKSSHHLHYRANLLFNLKRFAVLDKTATEELKTSERFDARIAFHHRSHFKGHRPCLYPKSGGIGRWIEQLEGKLRAAGVEILTASTISDIKTFQGKVTTLTVGGKTINIAHLFWSAAPAMFCRLASLEVNGPPPEFRSTVLAGFVFDKKFTSECDYVTVFDPDFASFRVTLYENFRKSEVGRFGATVEFMVAPERVEACDWTRIAAEEMSRMGLVDYEAAPRSQHVKVVRNGFPVQTNESVANLGVQARDTKAFSNLHLIGRASGEGWFLDGLIRGAWETAEAVAD